MGKCSNNDDHHTFITYNSRITTQYLEQNMTLCECLRRGTGICNESRVTCMKELWRGLCHKYDVNYMIMQRNMTMMERVIINGMVVSCMAILKEICPRGNNKVIIYFLISWWMFIIHARIVLTGNMIHVWIHRQTKCH